MDQIETKECYRCKTCLPLSEFYKHKTRGWQCYCKACCSVSYKEHRSNNPEYHRERDQKYAKENREKRNALQRAFHARNKEKLQGDARVRYHQNRDRRLVTMSAYQKANREELLVKGRQWHIKNSYGITQEEYLQLVESQGGGCAICGAEKSKDGRRLAVDHCHETGVVRGALCDLCNRGLGFFQDSTEKLARAIQYLSDTRRPLLHIESHEIDSA